MDDYRKKYPFGDKMNVDYLLKKCEKSFSSDDYERTVEICDEILKADLNNQVAIGYKARSLYLLGRCGDALTLLDNAIRLYPKNYHYLDIKAEVLMEMDDYDRALECFEEIFEIGVCDETALSFIKMDYRVCLGLKMDDLIEREKYVDVWKCYNHICEIESDDVERSVMIRRFKRHVGRETSRNKSRHYCVKMSSDEEKLKLIKFLDENGFESDMDFGSLLLIDVVGKTYNSISVDAVGANDIISESKFYDKVNFYPRGMIFHKEIFGEDGKLAYEGNTLHNAPYGFGKAYFSNGNVYREGIFDIKGIVQGREYYPSGRLRFEGEWCLTRGYGPNAPCEGDAYSEDGKLIYFGKFEIKRGGVGWPMIQKPKGFPLEQKERPKIEYY